MKRLYFLANIAFLTLILVMLGFADKTTGAESAEKLSAANCLSQVMDQFHQTFDVYTDSHAAGNHFVVKCIMGDSDRLEALPPMNECCTENPHKGINCIECRFKAINDQNWGGWFFLNGVLSGEDPVPQCNWGKTRDAGLDLRSASELTFWVKGALGGERVEFVALGVGRDTDETYPGSADRVSTDYITLSNTWQKISLNLTGLDLSYVLGGFGWVTNSPQNNGRDITFFLDDIQYQLNNTRKQHRLAEPRFLVSYKTKYSSLDFDVILRNTAFTYDNAVALLAFLAGGLPNRARLLADALVYAWNNDRFFNETHSESKKRQWLRNAYQGGDLILPPGWNPHNRPDTVRMPGFPIYYAHHPINPSQCGDWVEDKFQISIHTGNIAWAMLALLGYYERLGGEKYLTTVIQMGAWVEHFCRDSRGAGGGIPVVSRAGSPTRKN
jgi:hypothetical protein